MMMLDSNIEFCSEDRNVPFNNEVDLKTWLLKIIRSFDNVLGELNYIFCSDAYLLALNKEHLNHDYYTDVITFDYCEGNVISGDIFISVDMIAFNAEKFLKSKENELHRVMAHGLLHLCGLKDKSDTEAKTMREAEEKALLLLEER